MKKPLQIFKSFHQFISNLSFGILVIIMGSKINYAQTLINDFPITNGVVYSMLKDSSTMYLAGEFSFVGPSTGRTASIDAATGLYDPKFPKANGEVKVCVSDGQGGWYIGGQFTKVGDAYRNSAAHILPDGTVDSWSPNITFDGVPGSATVYTIVPFGKKIYIGGLFDKVNNVTRLTVAALEGDTVLPWNPQFDNLGFVTAIEPTDSVIYLGGNFSTINGGKVPRKNLACVDTSGIATSWAPNVQMRNTYNFEGIYGLYLSDTTLYMWGNISTIDGYIRMGIGSVYTTATTDGSYVTRWNPQSNSWLRGEPTSTLISSLAVKGDSIFIGGNFVHFGAYTRTGLALVSKATGQVLPWNHNFTKSKTYWDTVSYMFYDPVQVNGLSISGNKLYVAGLFDTVDTKERHNLAAFDLSIDTLTDWSPQASDKVNSISTYGNTIFAGGSFTSVNGVMRNQAAAIDLSTKKVLPFNPNIGGAWPICMAMSDSTLYIGGVFSAVGGHKQNCLAAVNKYSGEFIPGLPEAQYSINAMLVHNNTLFLGGNVLMSLGDSVRHGLASIDLTTNKISSLNPYTLYNLGWGNALVIDLEIADSTLYAVGSFAMPGDSVMRSIGAINSNTDEVLPFNPKFGGSKVLVSGDYLYVIGNFTSISGNPQKYIAKMNRFTGEVSNWDPNIFIAHNSNLWGWPEPNDIAISDSTLYICGPIAGIGGLTKGGVGSVDLTSSTPTTWGPNINGDVYRILIDKPTNTVFMCGNFDNVNDETQSYFAAYTDPSLGGITSIKSEQVIPNGFALMQNYPNPFNPSTIIKYSIQKSSFVTIKIYNMIGQVVKTLVNDQMNPGVYNVQWNGLNDAGRMAASGTYIYRIIAGSFVQAKKMILLK